MYVQKNLSPMPLVVSAQSLGSAAVINQFVCQNAVMLEFIGFLVSTATVSSGNIVVAVKKRPTVGSATGEVLIANITIPSGVAAGKRYGKMISPVQFQLGDVISFEVTTASAGGGAAGAGYAMVGVNFSPESLANNASFVKSA